MTEILKKVQIELEGKCSECSQPKPGHTVWCSRNPNSKDIESLEKMKQTCESLVEKAQDIVLEKYNESPVEVQRAVNYIKNKRRRD